jgi:hypothetical protein
MDALSCFPSELGDFDDEFYQYQTSVDGGYQNPAQSIPYYDAVTQPVDQIYDDSYTVGSNKSQFDGDPYPYQGTMTGPPSAALTESPVEDFQYIDFGPSYVPEPQASLNMPVSPVGVLDGYNDNSARVADSSNATSISSARKDNRASKKGSSKNPPHSRQRSVNTPYSSHKASPRPESSAAEPSSNVNSRSAKKSKGPPKTLLTVFDSNIEPHTRRKSRSAFSEEGKKKVEAVRRVGACIECRFRKRTVSLRIPNENLELT